MVKDRKEVGELKALLPVIASAQDDLDEIISLDSRKEMSGGHCFRLEKK